MAHKYGPSHESVTAFLEEVRATPKEAWRPLMEGDTTVQEQAAAVKATVGAMSAAVRAAVDKAGRDAFASVGLTNDDLDRRPRTNARDRVASAAIALAMGDKLAAEHREVLLRVFVDAGFTSVSGS